MLRAGRGRRRIMASFRGETGRTLDGEREMSAEDETRLLSTSWSRVRGPRAFSWPTSWRGGAPAPGGSRSGWWMPRSVPPSTARRLLCS